jgi:hypothetical protein
MRRALPLRLAVDMRSIASRRLKMIAITIGVGPLYRRAAELAAECLRLHTGLSTIILDSSYFVGSGLRHPAALKLQLFDLTTEDSVLYFDADWFCLGEWSPQALASETAEMVACHDFVLWRDLTDHSYEFDQSRNQKPVDDFPGSGEYDLRQPYIDEITNFCELRLPPWKWINSGLFIANRERHWDLMRLAESYYLSCPGHHPKYYEQPALVKAIETFGYSIRFLPRRYNVLTTRPTRWACSVIGAHLKLSECHAFAEMIKTLEINPRGAHALRNKVIA